MAPGKIGIDAGGTLLKVAYEEAGKIRYRKHGYGEAEAVFSWMNLVSQDAEAAVTGGRAGWVKKEFFPQASVIPEFEALSSGAALLLGRESVKPEGKFLLANIGTGTSILLIENGESQRVGGSGLGGGTLTGLGELLAGTADFDALVKLAAEGDRSHADMLVRDIYKEGGEPLNGEMTAANFAKGKGAGKEDLCAALVNMISETIILLLSQTATTHQVDTIVFAGSTLSGNGPLKKSLEAYSQMLGLTPYFPGHGEYFGAAGALLAVGASLGRNEP